MLKWIYPPNIVTYCHKESEIGAKHGPEWTSTQRCTNVDGWCTDRILFSILVPSQVDFFCFPFLSPDLSSFFLEFYFLPAHPCTTSHCPPLTYSPILYINSLSLCVCLTRQFCCKSILWQNRPLHFLWQNRPQYNFGAAGRGGGETHASHRLRLSVRLSLSYFNLL